MISSNLRNQLTDLKLYKFIEMLDTNFDVYANQDMSFSEILSLLSDAELQYRNQKRIERLINGAKFRYPSAQVEDINYAPKRKLNKDIIMGLVTGNWVKEHQNLIILGATGTGKTWLASAIGVQMCRLGYNTMFVTAYQLAEQLREALINGSIGNLKRKIIKSKLLIIDDFALGKMDIQIAPLLLEIIDLQAMNGSLMITSQFPVEFWHDKFDDATIADAILDRILNQSRTIDIKGNSMRKPVKD